MGSRQCFAKKALLLMLLCYIFSAVQLKPLPAKDPSQTAARERRLPILGMAVAGGATWLGIHEIKKHNPCAFHGWGITDKGQMDHKLAANERCREYFDKYKDELSKCPDPQSADCSEVDGDTKCAVHLADGSTTAIYDCA